ncbi:MAG: hypothetical protein ACP5U1_14025 [Desulfomonilaceae bacterium]
MLIRIIIYFLLNLLLLSVLCSCGGKIAKTGVGAVTDVNAWGGFSLAYPDGSHSVKRFNEDSVRKDIELARRNLLQPARYVETPKGGALTFSDGKTILYYDYK